MVELRVLILVIASAGIFFLCIWSKHSHERRLYSLAGCLWLFNLCVFHIVRLSVGGIDVGTLNAWALAIQLQGALTLMVVGYFLARWDK